MIGKIQTHSLPNNQNKARTKLSIKPKNISGHKKRNGPITSTFGPIKLDLFFIESQKCTNFLAMYLVIHFFNFFCSYFSIQKFND